MQRCLILPLYQINHSRLANGVVPRPWAGRRAGSTFRTPSWNRLAAMVWVMLKLGLVIERWVADRSGRATGVTPSPRMAPGIRGDAAGLQEEDIRRFRVRHQPTTRCIRRWWGCGPGPAGASGSGLVACVQLLDFVPTTLAWSPVGGGPPRILPPWNRTGPGSGRHRTTPGPDASAAMYCWPTGAIRTPWLARYACNSTTATPHARKHDRGIAKSPGNVTGCAATMAMRCCRRSLSRPGGPGAGPSGRRRRNACGGQVPTSALHGRSLLDLEWTLAASRVSITRTTTAVRPPCAIGHARPVREHSMPGWITSTKLRAFWKTTTSHGAAATFSPGVHEAAAVISFLSPGLPLLLPGSVPGRV